jgi:hypothetical protein
MKKTYQIQVFTMLGTNDDRLVFTAIAAEHDPLTGCRFVRDIKRHVTPERAHEIRVASAQVYIYNETAQYRPFSAPHAIGWELHWEKPQRRHHGHQ